MDDFDLEALEDLICVTLPSHRGSCSKLAVAVEKEFNQWLKHKLDEPVLLDAIHDAIEDGEDDTAWAAIFALDEVKKHLNG